MMRKRLWLLLSGLLLSLAAGGCTDTGSAADNDRHGAFYGGVTGGGTWR